MVGQVGTGGGGGGGGAIGASREVGDNCWNPLSSGLIVSEMNTWVKEQSQQWITDGGPGGDWGGGGGVQ